MTVKTTMADKNNGTVPQWDGSGEKWHGGYSLRLATNAATVHTNWLESSQRMSWPCPGHWHNLTPMMERKIF